MQDIAVHVVQVSLKVWERGCPQRVSQIRFFIISLSFTWIIKYKFKYIINVWLLKTAGTTEFIRSNKNRKHFQIFLIYVSTDDD
jgi:hypothetical protein